MEIFKYDSYEDYVKAQIDGNLEKIEVIKTKNTSYVEESTIEKIASRKPEAQRILCHGTRNAKEQIYFQKHIPKAYIIGSEISINAEEFPMTVQHDFNMVKEEWVNSFDIVYSNSFDHSISPFETLKIWRDQLNENGILFLEHTVSTRNHVSNRIDPLKIETSELIDLIDKSNMMMIEKFAASKLGYILVCEKK